LEGIKIHDRPLVVEFGGTEAVGGCVRPRRTRPTYTRPKKAEKAQVGDWNPVRYCRFRSNVDI
jgi:hypothetical protein